VISTNVAPILHRFQVMVDYCSSSHHLFRHFAPPLPRKTHFRPRGPESPCKY